MAGFEVFINGRFSGVHRGSRGNLNAVIVRRCLFEITGQYVSRSRYDYATHLPSLRILLANPINLTRLVSELRTSTEPMSECYNFPAEFAEDLCRSSDMVKSNLMRKGLARGRP
jgi:hypothetical protein